LTFLERIACADSRYGVLKVEFEAEDSASFQCGVLTHLGADGGGGCGREKILVMPLFVEDGLAFDLPFQCKSKSPILHPKVVKNEIR